MKKHLLLLLAVFAGATMVRASVVNGTCGENLTWSLNTQDSTLVIEGSGAMTDYSSSSDVPWVDYRLYISTVSLPDGLTNIGNRAFFNCDNLRVINIPNGVTYLGVSAFDHCVSLTNISLPNSISSLRDYAFYECYALREIVIPENVDTINKGTFTYCIKLTTITIPNNVTGIAESAFKNCNRLQAVVMGENVNRIGKDAFKDCGRLLRITLQNSTPPAGVTSCGVNFNACVLEVNEEDIDTYETALGWQDFSHIYAIGATRIVTFVDYDGSLFAQQILEVGQSATDPGVPVRINYYFRGWDKDFSNVTEDMVVSTLFAYNGSGRVDGVYYSFYGESLTARVSGYENSSVSGDIVLPDSVTYGDYKFCLVRLNDGAFSGSGISSITIPAGVTYIGSSAFNNCSSLAFVTMLGETPATLSGSSSFGYYAEYPIYVPCGTLDAYREAWSYYTDRIQYAPVRYDYAMEVGVNDAKMGHVNEPQTMCDEMQLEAVPNYGHHFVQWSDGVTTNLRAIDVTQATNLTAEFAKNPIITYLCDKTQGTIEGDTTLADAVSGIVTFTAVAEYGYQFVQWSDGVTANPRTIVLTKDTTFTAEFAAKTNGQCGDNLVWILTDSTLTIAGVGDMWNEQPWVVRREQIARIILPEGLTSIGDRSFASCIHVKEITIPESLTRLGTGAFAGCENLKTVVWNAKDCPSFMVDGEYSFPFWVEGVDITSMTLGNHVEVVPVGLCYGMLITSIDIPASVKEIGMYAFGYCEGLKSITMHEGLETIGEYAFVYCSGIKSMTIPSSVTAIGELSWAYCSSLDSLTVLGDNVSVGPHPMFSCTKLSYLKVPASMLYYTANDYPTNFSTRLETVIVTGGTMTGKAYNLLELSYQSLKHLDMSGVDEPSFAEEQFKEFRRLTQLELPTSLNSVPYASVAKAYYLKKIIIPEYVTEIDDRAFEDCRSMDTVIFAGNMVRRIGNWAFYNCHNLYSINIPDGVTEIGDAAFYGCAYAQELHLPSSVQAIGDNTFAYCTRLNKMVVEAVVPPTVEDRAFLEVSTQAPVYVPDQSVTDYLSHPVWGRLNIQGKNSAITGLNNTTVHAAGKQIVNGQLLIALPDGSQYTAAGVRVK